MATEIVIPVNVELKASTSSGKPGASFEGLNGSFFIHSAKKLISATGNSDITRAIGQSAKYGAMLGQVATNPANVVGWANILIELTAEGIKKIEEAKQNALKDNNAYYNQLRKGTQYVGNYVTIEKNWLGKKSYNRAK